MDIHRPDYSPGSSGTGKWSGRCNTTATAACSGRWLAHRRSRPARSRCATTVRVHNVNERKQFREKYYEKIEKQFLIYILLLYALFSYFQIFRLFPKNVFCLLFVRIFLNQTKYSQKDIQ